MKRVAVSVLLALSLFACAKEEASKDKPLSVPGEKLHDVRGKILGRDADDNTIRMDHEAIPGFMEPMVMDYSVRGASVSTLPADGSTIVAKVHVTDDGYWLTDVRPSP